MSTQMSSGKSILRCLAHRRRLSEPPLTVLTPSKQKQVEPNRGDLFIKALGINLTACVSI